MAEHSELINEMTLLEKMTTQERLKLARKRRIQQLKKWSQREKEYNNKRKKSDSNSIRAKGKKPNYKVHFVPSVMLLEAAARNDIDEVRRLLLLGVSPDSTNEDGLTALHQCCIDDSEEMMKILIEFGANVNAKDSEQWTPLHAAATCGHLHLVKYLITKNADLLAVNADGNMPYDICEDELTLDFIESDMANKGITQEMIDNTRASSEITMLNDLKKIVEENGELDYRDAQGATPLHIASANGYVSVVEFLLDHHVAVDVCDGDLWQPIHASACWGHPEVLELLIQSGSDINAKTKNGETPLDICEDIELKERIIQLKSEMETKKHSHPTRLKRSHSQNTRSQSVRRTSIREKSQISRREAREEARLRQEKDQNENTDDDEVKQRLDVKEFEKETVVPNTLPPSNENSVVDTHNAEFESKKSSISNDQVDSEAVVIRNPTYSDKENQWSSSGAESVKVEIHVTVNTTPPYNGGTLSDLKKQRSDLRHRGSLSLVPTESSSSGKDAPMNASNSNNHHISATYVYDPQPTPPSPGANLRKFRGDPSEVVGGNNKKRCCIVM